MREGAFIGVKLVDYIAGHVRIAHALLHAWLQSAQMCNEAAQSLGCDAQGTGYKKRHDDG
jgi:hypothetical protein